MTIFSLHIWWITIAPYMVRSHVRPQFSFGLFLYSENSQKRCRYPLFATILWVILGWRFGYVLFYNLGYYLTNPLEIFMPWKGVCHFMEELSVSSLLGYSLLARFIKLSSSSLIKWYGSFLLDSSSDVSEIISMVSFSAWRDMADHLHE